MCMVYVRAGVYLDARAVVLVIHHLCPALASKSHWLPTCSISTPEMLYPETTMKCSTHEMCYLAWCVRLSTTVCDVRLESESDALLQSAVKISTTLRWLRRGRGTVAVGTAQRPRAEPGAGHDCSHQRGLLLWIQHSVSCCLYICCVAVRVCI